MTAAGTDMSRGGRERRKRKGDMGKPWVLPTKIDARRLGPPWETMVQDLSDREGETQSTRDEKVPLEGRENLRMRASTLSNPALMSTKGVETLL